MFEIDRKKFGAFVAQLRKENGYTQKELAKQLFISDKAVSKWETGVSIPDVALLIPLAELLGVSVTELLMCERIKDHDTLDTSQVDSIVKTAISYSGEHPKRAYQTKHRWAVIYALSVVMGGMGLLLNHRYGQISEMAATAVVLGVIFGAYFCFFVKTNLPAYYDENRIGMVHDGVFRMNVPGLVFNNSNWPYIVLTGRSWACLMVALFPALTLLMTFLCPEFWFGMGRYVFLALILGGLFIPMYVVGKKYE